MIRVTEFDFSSKRDASVDLQRAVSEPREGTYYWIDADADGIEEVLPALRELSRQPALTAEDLRQPQPSLLQVTPQCLFFQFAETRIVQGSLKLSYVTVLLGTSFLATIALGESRFLQDMRVAFHDDFVRHSISPGFLLFEMADFLCKGYQSTLRVFADEIGKIQEELFENPDDKIFHRVSDLTRELYAYRSSLVTAREILHELATRRSQFIPETTQPFLEKKGLLLERLSHDLSLESDVLSETLNLYMGFVSHRTNKVVNRLTVISVIFLPLTFMVGVYGMNFENIPELGWRYGYLAFWITALTVVGFSVAFLKRMKWL